MIRLFLFLMLAVGSGYVFGDEPAHAFRTDDSKDASLQWYEPVKGEFPPENSAHYIPGELIKVDSPERELVIRVDRNDTQQRGVWDLPLPLSMLPYGSIFYHGSPAALCDIPLGTHLHTWCYLKAKDDDRPPIAVFNDRISPEANFRRCIRIEDDFSYRKRQQQIWKIDRIDREKKKMIATLQQEEKPVGGSKQFDILASTRVLQGDGFGTLGMLAEGQLVQLNLTWVGLYGPGRVLDIWLDERSREVSTQFQLERHRVYMRERGLPGWVDAVDDEKQIVTLTFFDGVDPLLFKELTNINPTPLGWPTSVGAKNDLAPKGTIAVARQTLMTYDPTNDRKGGNILDICQVPLRPGCSGVQIQVECGLLLEGYRPTEIVRFYPASWPFITVPLEESFQGRE
jgi:hypothetical protein